MTANASGEVVPLSTTPRAEVERPILAEVARILSSTLELAAAFQQIMAVISERLGMRRGTLVLLDDATGRLRTEAAVGLSNEDISRNRFALGEGVTGNVVATGRPRIIGDVRRDPDFLNRTSRLKLDGNGGGPVSFLCVPIKIDDRPAGALAVDKPFESDAQLKADHEFLDILAAFLAQAIQLNRMVMRQKEELLEENAQPPRTRFATAYRFENIIGDSARDAPTSSPPSARSPTAARTVLHAWRDRHRQGDDRQGHPLQQRRARTSLSFASTVARSPAPFWNPNSSVT